MRGFRRRFAGERDSWRVLQNSEQDQNSEEWNNQQLRVVETDAIQKKTYEEIRYGYERKEKHFKSANKNIRTVNKTAKRQAVSLGKKPGVISRKHGRTITGAIRLPLQRTCHRGQEVGC